jgi:hypothetical protein
MNDEVKSPEVTTMEEQEARAEEAKALDPREQAKQAYLKEIEAFDFEKAMMLMSVQEKVANTGVRNTAIAGIAAVFLEQLNLEAQRIQRERGKAYKNAEVQWAIMERQRIAEDAKRDEVEEAKKAEVEDRPQGEAPGTKPQPTDPRSNPAHPVGSRTARVADNNARRV